MLLRVEFGNLILNANFKLEIVAVVALHLYLHRVSLMFSIHDFLGIPRTLYPDIFWLYALISSHQIGVTFLDA